MTKYISTLLLCLILVISTQEAEAGNPDRQGEAGAYELLMNPWARSSGVHGMMASRVQGVEAMRINPAGLGRISQTEVLLSRSIYLQGTGINLNALGIGQKVGKNGTIGISLMSVDFGDIPITTSAQPEGVGGTYSPSFFNLGLAYSHTFDKKISVGVVGRLVSESVADVSATAMAVDAGIQYVTGPNDNVRFGISLRNVGTQMRFSGEGLSFTGNSPEGDYTLTLEQRSAKFELPSLLNIGGSYDFIFDKNRVTVMGNFTSNSFGRDHIGGGVEYAFSEMFMVRGGYRYEIGGVLSTADASAYTGLSGGVSLDVPTNKKNDNKFGIDYSYRASNPWGGTHSIGVRLSL
jgi:opacity protein-like surface antigen